MATVRCSQCGRLHLATMEGMCEPCIARMNRIKAQEKRWQVEASFEGDAPENVMAPVLVVDQQEWDAVVRDQVSDVRVEPASEALAKAQDLGESEAVIQAMFDALDNAREGWDEAWDDMPKPEPRYYSCLQECADGLPCPPGARSPYCSSG